MLSVNELVKKRAAAVDALKALAAKDVLTAEEQSDWEVQERTVRECDTDIPKARAAQAAAAAGAQPVAGQDGPRIEAGDDDVYSSETAAKARGLKTHKGLRAIACAKIFHAAAQNPERARQIAVGQYGERHSISRAFEPVRSAVTRALVVSVGAEGGFIVPPDYANEIIELLRPKAVVRASGPRVIPMPRGTMTLPGQSSAATATYGSEVAKIPSSQPGLQKIVASYKKLTALVPVSNDMMRYADPAADAFVRDDLVKVEALKEDYAFILGDGTSDSPLGFLYFANRWVNQNKGTMGAWSTTADSTFAVNGTDPANSTGGNFITSTANYSLATVASELGGAVNRLDQANVPEDKRVWFMNPRCFNYLYNVQNSLGVYVYREELDGGKLLGYPVKKTTQIPTGYWDTTGTNKDLSFIFLVEMDEAMLLDSMSLELAVSREGTYVDGGGSTVSAFATDQSIIRAISEHDFHMRHDQSVAVIQGVRWAPAIS